MKRIVFSIVAILIISIIAGCAKTPPTEEQIFELIKKVSVISSHESFVLKELSIESSTFENVLFKAVVTLTFIYDGDSEIWSREDKYDFIPSGTTLKRGVNSFAATAFFERSYAGDGSWHLANFAP